MTHPFLHKRAVLWVPQYEDLKRWAFVPIWTLLYRNYRTLMQNDRIDAFLATIPRDAAWEQQRKWKTLSQFDWSASPTRNILRCMESLIQHKSAHIVMPSFLSWLLEETGSELMYEKGWTNNTRVVYINYPDKKHLDITVLEEGRSLPSLFFYVMQRKEWTGYGYLHFIKQIPPFHGTDLLEWMLYLARNLGCTELHLFDEATVSCTQSDLRPGDLPISQLIDFPISLSVLGMVMDAQTWYERIGFAICSDQKTRHGPYFLPWKRETAAVGKGARSLLAIPASESRTVQQWKRIPQRLRTIPASSILPALDRILRGGYEKARTTKATIDRTELATIWSPLSAYLRLYLQEKHPDQFGSFLAWLYRNNCIVYHAFQSVWIPFENPDADAHDGQAVSVQALIKAHPEFAPIQQIANILGTSRFYWINPQVAGPTHEPLMTMRTPGSRRRIGVFKRHETR